LALFQSGVGEELVRSGGAFCVFGLDGAWVGAGIGKMEGLVENGPSPSLSSSMGSTIRAAKPSPSAKKAIAVCS